MNQTLFLIVATVVTVHCAHAMEKTKSSSIITNTTFRHNNSIIIQAEKQLPTNVLVEYGTMQYCCGKPYLSFTTIQIGKEDLIQICKITKELNDESKLSFYSSYFNEKKQTIQARDNDLFAISSVENGAIVITKKSTVSNQQTQEVARFTLK